MPTPTELHPVALAVGFDAAFNARDPEGLASLLHPLAELHEPDGAVHVGRQGARAFLGRADGEGRAAYVIGSRYRGEGDRVSGWVLLGLADSDHREPAGRMRLDVDMRVRDGRIISIEQKLADAEEEEARSQRDTSVC